MSVLRPTPGHLVSHDHEEGEPCRPPGVVLLRGGDGRGGDVLLAHGCRQRPAHRPAVARLLAALRRHLPAATPGGPACR